MGKMCEMQTERARMGRAVPINYASLSPINPRLVLNAWAAASSTPANATSRNDWEGSASRLLQLAVLILVPVGQSPPR